MIIPKMVEPKFEKLNNKLQEMRQHNVFSSIRTINELHTFMEWHVFAVWDFMSLTKRLQQDFTCVSLPWLPPKNHEAACLINQIVLGEETDHLPNGKTLSHFEMYLIAMEEIGASTNQIKKFIECLQSGITIPDALEQAKVPAAIQKFVQSTMTVVFNGNVAQVLGSFFYGREDSIPEMFSYLLKSWNIDTSQAETFVYYLKRHIELDSDEHGPAVQKIMKSILGEDLVGWNDLLDTAVQAVDDRIALWNELEKEISPIAAVV